MLMISMIEGRSVGTGTVAGSSATISTTWYRDICIAPCTIEAPPGIGEFFARGGGHVATATKLDLRAGTNIVDIDPGSSALRYTGAWCTLLGGTAALLGATFLVADSDGAISAPSTYVALLAGGGAVLGGGFALTISNRGRWSVSYASP
jgi:hypothetical protein